jgi:hypothetical protein
MLVEAFGRGRFVSELRSARSRIRPWIATIAAYALALQVLLTGVVGGHVMPAGDASASGLFVICHGNGSTDNQDLPDKQPAPRSPCLLCTLTNAPCAILPTGDGITLRNAIEISTSVARTDGRIIEFDSPTGQYPRGPPSTFPFSADPLPQV